GMLVVDVATEVHRTCLLPVRADAYPQNMDPMVYTFEMSGRLCLAVNLYDPRCKLQFWVMSPPDQWVEGDDSKLCWDLLYSSYINDSYRDSYRFNTPTGAWFDDGTLCFTHRDFLFKHSTTGRSPEPSPDADCPQCDLRLELPPKPSNCKWNIVGGYRSSLLSPLTLATPPWSWDGEEERKEFEHAMFLTLRRHQ
uniref:F-box associated domain-containing protein n=2 Tax=Aegilops tauschii subsp. strangulata TaxID=200361 RepID=A0A453MBG2_AEGTS